MKKNGLLVLTVMVLSLDSAFLFSAPAVTAAPRDSGDPVILIETQDAGLGYKKTEYQLEKGVTYTIVFNNTQSTPHNVIIADRTVESESDAVVKSGDVVIGEEQGAGPGVWNVTWTAPNEDKVVPFFCSLPGHFLAGMRGVFVIGNPSVDQYPSWARPTDTSGIVESSKTSVSTVMVVRTSSFGILGFLSALGLASLVLWKRHQRCPS